MSTTDLVDKARLRRHWKTLCEQIGFRYSGTDGEQRAADYIEGQFGQCGLQNVHQHRFEFPNWSFSGCHALAGRGKASKRLTTARPFCYSPSTPAAGVRGRLVYLQSGDEMDFKQETRGKVGLLIGSLALSDPDMKKRLMRAGLVALLVVDARLPVKWISTAGSAPQWMDGYRLPTASVSYFEAHDLVKDMPQTVHLTIKARTFPAMSQNVIGEVVGSRRPDEVIVVCGHHDCVWGNVGADDNASGVLFTLELARIFGRRRSHRTVRFISYGVEEKLSVGAYLYMRSLSVRERKRCVLVLNADGISSHVGIDTIHVTGSPSLENLALDVWSGSRHPAVIERSVCPYSDHFPLNICGVPAVWVSRPNMLGGSLWQLHSKHDNLKHVSVKVISRNINTAAVFLQKVAGAPRLPFKAGIAPAVMKEVRIVARREYRHPWSVSQFRYE